MPNPVEPYALQKPEIDTERPLILDSPHSGFLLPPDFRNLATTDQLMTSWDAFVDQLWDPCVSQGATLLAANFPRAYIDPNRREDDIDPRLIEEGADIACRPGKYSERGMGLIRAFILPGIPLYDRRLSADEVRHRIGAYYRPYHQALRDNIRRLRDAHGQVWHFNCHSMKSRGNAMNVDSGQLRADIVIGDRQGRSAAPEFTQVIAQSFAQKGYQVAINDPYEGGYGLAAHGRPDRGVHSLQIELNRALYLDELRFEKTAGFDRLRTDLADVMASVIAWIDRQLENLHHDV